MTEKDRLRRDLRKRRRDFVGALAADERAGLERRIAERIGARLRGAAVVASYRPMGFEVDPGACEALATDAAIILPFFAQRGDVMTFRVAGSDLEPGPWGVMQPATGAAERRPGLVLVPLVGADERGKRLGQGKGHYDRALAALRANGGVVTIGLAWEAQIVSDLPFDEWDQPLDMIATPSRVITP